MIRVRDYKSRTARLVYSDSIDHFMEFGAELVESLGWGKVMGSHSMHENNAKNFLDE